MNLFSKERSQLLVKILVYSGFGIIAIGIVLFSWKECSTFNFDEKINADKIAQFGDFISGIVGTLWSLAGLLLIYLAFLNQQKATEAALKAVRTQGKALKMQSKELELQRKELKETRKVFKEQSTTMTVQRFENTFFQLLQLHHQIVDAIDLDEERYDKNGPDKWIRGSKDGPKIETVTVKGRDVFKLEYEELAYLTKDVPEEELHSKYLIRWEHIQTDFGHYFKNLYRIVKFVNESKAFKGTKKQQYRIKYKYISMLKAQLSDFEVLWLFYNVTIGFGTEKFKKLVEEYSMLKNCPTDLFANAEHEGMINEVAFNPKMHKYYKKSKK